MDQLVTVATALGPCLCATKEVGQVVLDPAVVDPAVVELAAVVRADVSRDQVRIVGI